MAGMSRAWAGGLGRKMYIPGNPTTVLPAAHSTVLHSRPFYRPSRVSGNPERYCVRQAGLWQGIPGFPLTREGRLRGGREWRFLCVIAPVSLNKTGCAPRSGVLY